MISTAAPPEKKAPAVRRSHLAVFASVKLTVALITLIAATILLGAWCPQESQVGFQKVVEQFGPQWAENFKKSGITDIFHTPFFLLLIGLLTVNMIACSVQRVFPKVKTLKQPLAWLKDTEILRLPYWQQATLNACPDKTLSEFEQELKRRGYSTVRSENRLVAEWGKFGRLAPTITHIGLLSLLVGVTVTSWTGFTGFQPVPLGEKLDFKSSEHSKMWIGKLPEWKVLVNATSREDYPSGDPKQWYSDLSVIDTQGKEVKRQQISVNNPLTYQNVDIYQSSWGLDKLVLGFNEHTQEMQLRPMGKLYAAFLPLDPGTVLIFSVRDQTHPLRLFAKTPEWQGPRLLKEIMPGGKVQLGAVNLTYKKLIPVTGLQYKCDPGLPITYVAFGFIMAGVLLAAVPHRQLWAHTQECDQKDDACVLSVGGRSLKGRAAFEKNVRQMVQKTSIEMGDKINV